ncbi:PfkB family carbohydrate kinase [Methylomonas sp. EFPC3]|uniref:PfkB family carbohydrate kinase n=1 Tax=Methylomonas sp. EFPC3 TaxID=3021710 RepID=UPI002417A1D9|nr:PfkB family carbohydrate kinase [Methylomonas sp. EFPC3]WFP50111.1 PfkB family carbohydrate kinase [Methylomonas sp. EFPC3]
MLTLVLGSYVQANCLQVPDLPAAGQSLLAAGYWSEHGGKGLNVGVALHALAAETALLLPVGDDNGGRQISAELSQMGLDTRWVIVCAAQSGYGVGLIDARGDNVIAVFPGANAHLTPAMVCDALDRSRPRRVYAQLEIPLESVLAAFSAARRLGSYTVLNPSPWRPITSELLALTDTMIVNAAEAATLFADNGARLTLSAERWLELLPEMADTIAWQGDWLIVTLGDQGCVALGRQEVIHVGAWPVEVRDATGAGDAFSAGWLWAQDRYPPEHALLAANACGAFIAERDGVLAHLPDNAALTAFMASRPAPGIRRISRAF